MVFHCVCQSDLHCKCVVFDTCGTPYLSICTETLHMESGPSFTPEGIAEAVGVPRAKLDQECSEEHVKDISLFLESWETLAPHLNLKDTDIE